MRTASLPLALLAACGGAGTDPMATASSGSASTASSAGASKTVADGSDPTLQVASDAVGTVASFSKNGFDPGPTRAFFSVLGTNGRSCNTCHVQENAWTISAGHAQAVAASTPNDPLFAPVDGSDCPPTSPSDGPDARRSSMLTEHGLIRVELALPSTADFSVVSATNPKGCSISPGDPAIGGKLFLFRRPLPSANLGFLSAVMWDGRQTVQKITTSHLGSLEPLLTDLSSQDDDATTGHAQGTHGILGTPAGRDALAFEVDLTAAQRTIGDVDLAQAGGHGGPAFVNQSLEPQYSVGENDPLASGFTSHVFTLFADWEPDGQGRSRPGLTDAQAAIGRGEALFNNRTFTIANIAGLNSAASDPLFNPADPLANKPIQGTCGVCHNSFDVGNHSTPLAINIGVTMATPTDNDGKPIPSNLLETGELPVYTVRAQSGTEVQVTDPGRAVISGHFLDVGKTKGPVLRGLAARAPYFHNGSARDLEAVVKFYNARFAMNLSDREVEDLVAFLNAL